LQKLLRQILTSRVYEAAVETPLDHAPALSAELGNQVFLKREDLQPVFSFKLRGAYNCIAQLDSEQLKAGVITASAGNHAQGVAFSARHLGVPAVIVMPVTTPEIKVEAVRALGAEVLLHGDNYSEAKDYCDQIVADRGMTFIHPFDDELVIAGQGTVGDEIVRQMSGQLDAVFIPIGGGGLAAGVGAFIKGLCPEVMVIGVEPCDSDAMARSLEAGERVCLDSVGIFADGVAVREVGEQTFALCRKVLDGVVRVSTDEICSAIKAIYQATRTIVEPAGALGLAGMRSYVRTHELCNKKLVAITSGANMNFERLRYVGERTLIGENREALFAVTIPEKPGALRTLCEKVLGERSITEFNYRMAGHDAAHIFVGMSIDGDREREDLAAQMQQLGYQVKDLTGNELAKTHVRYMVGGRSEVAAREYLYRFWFPERPGALARFLTAMGASWNISLFHYRAQGGEFGRVLIGLEIPPGEEQRLEPFLDTLGYRYVDETDNEAYRLFL